MADHVTIKVSIKVRWWVRPYLGTLALLSLATGADPDEAKVTAFILAHGIIVECPVRSPWWRRFRRVRSITQKRVRSITKNRGM